MAADSGDGPLLAGEMKELRRVYDHLCFFMPKHAIRAQLNPMVDRKQKIVMHRKNPDMVRIMDAEGRAMSEDAIDEEFNRLCEEIERLENEIAEYDKRPDRKIRAQDLAESLRALGKRCAKREVEDMIWEVDENLDACVDWAEFRLMYERNISDKTGLEPFQLFNIVQFMMYDKDYSGTVSIDETMTMLYQRYGKDKLEAQMKLLFGDDLRSSDGEGELSFEQYLRAVSVRLPSARMLRTAKTQPPRPSGRVAHGQAALGAGARDTGPGVGGASLRA